MRQPAAASPSVQIVARFSAVLLDTLKQSPIARQAARPRLSSPPQALPLHLPVILFTGL
jgi:hypothetical protein